MGRPSLAERTPIVGKADGPMRPARVAWRWLIVFAVLGIVEVILISMARPFTTLADVVVSIALATLVVAVVAQRADRVPSVFARRRLEVDQRRGPATWWVWPTLFAAVTAWELVCLAGSPRHDRPTFSYFLDLVTIHPAGRVVAFVGWLALGGYLVTR
jgi:hypothetical protein